MAAKAQTNVFVVNAIIKTTVYLGYLTTKPYATDTEKQRVYYIHECDLKEILKKNELKICVDTEKMKENVYHILQTKQDFQEDFELHQIDRIAFEKIPFEIVDLLDEDDDEEEDVQPKKKKNDDSNRTLLKMIAKDTDMIKTQEEQLSKTNELCHKNLKMISVLTEKLLRQNERQATCNERAGGMFTNNMNA